MAADHDCQLIFMHSLICMCAICRLISLGRAAVNHRDLGHGCSIAHPAAVSRTRSKSSGEWTLSDGMANDSFVANCHRDRRIRVRLPCLLEPSVWLSRPLKKGFRSPPFDGPQDMLREPRGIPCARKRFSRSS